MLALNQTLVGVYYDSAGNLTKVVHADNDDFAPHADKALLGVTLAKKSYDALPIALNTNGFANPYDLNKAVVAQASALNPTIGLKLQASIDATTAQLAAQALDQPIL
jgi:hypothetical protein